MDLGIIEADSADKYFFLIDSGLIIDWDGFLIYNANDCRPFIK